MSHIEVDQQTDRPTTQLQVREKLRHVNREQFVDSLEFYDDAVFDEEVDPISCVESDCVVYNRQRALMFKSQAIPRELVAQADRVRPLEQTGSKRRVNLHRSSDDVLRDVFVTHQDCPSVPSVVYSFVKQEPVRA